MSFSKLSSLSSKSPAAPGSAQIRIVSPPGPESHFQQATGHLGCVTILPQISVAG